MKHTILSGILYLFVAALFMRCTQGDKHFMGSLVSSVLDVSQVEGSSVKHSVSLTPLMQTKNNTYGFFVCDSLAFFTNNATTDHFVDVYHLYNGQRIGEYLHRGHGKNEFTVIPNFKYIYKENGELKTMNNAVNERVFFTWNISGSLEMKADVLENLIPHDYRKYYHSAPEVLSPFTDSLVVCITHGTLYSGTTMTVPEIHLVSRSSGVDVRTFAPLRNPIFNRQSRVLAESFFTGFTLVKPDGKKVVSTYCYLPLIAIVDLATHETHGYMIGKKLDYSVFETDMEEAKRYYMCVACSDNHIFALWNGREAKYDKRTISGFNLLQIFDWDGKLVDVVRLEHEVNDIYFDHFSGVLYACSEKSSYLYRVDFPYK